MKKKTILLYLFLFAVTLFLTAYSGVDRTPKEELKLELMIEDRWVKAGEPIICKAILTYAGAQESREFYFGENMVLFAVVGGDYLNYSSLATRQPGLGAVRTFHKDEPLEFQFRKRGGGYQKDDEAAAAFWNAYLSEPELKLEPGIYKIVAQVAYATSYGGHGTTRTVSKNVIVR